MTCLWPMPTGKDATPPDWESLPDPVKDVARELACRTLERLSGYRVGTCPVTIRPAHPHHLDWCRDFSVAYADVAPSLTPFQADGGEWQMGAGCTCGRVVTVCEVVLPGPVGRVDEVKVDGLVVPSGNYKVENGNRLTWRGPDPCPWPRNQDMNLADTEPGTMSITYVNALLPGDVGLRVMSILAVEFGLAMVDDENCRLPANTQTVTRQGVALTLIPGTFPNGQTGIREVDAWLGLYNPEGLTIAPQVWSPDLPRHRLIGG